MNCRCASNPCPSISNFATAISIPITSSSRPKGRNSSSTGRTPRRATRVATSRGPISSSVLRTERISPRNISKNSVKRPALPRTMCNACCPSSPPANRSRARKKTVRCSPSGSTSWNMNNPRSAPAE